uniref:E-selectin-like n=1 Tax=Styela clava TaxID=7725 RepID=UPI00193A7DE9|nr:E-selectin-like [Styela clava]
MKGQTVFLKIVWLNWFLVVLQCSAENCTVSSPLHGTTDCTGTVDVGTICNITCDDGYFNNSVRSAECIKQDEWDNNNWNDTCQAIMCPESSFIANSQQSTCIPSNSYNDTCDITCLDGYYNDGDKQATCKDTNENNDTNKYGDWNEGSANCTAITCPVSFTIISNSQQSNCTSISFNDTCDITCLDGYYNDGDKQATCTDSNENNDTNRDGNWDEGSANCTAITCPVSFTIISNSQQSNCTSISFNDTCDITCLDGYYNDGDKQATCTDSNENNDTNRDGNWDEGSANCTAITCPVSFTIISNSQQSNCTSISFNDTCDITCLDGYYNDGDKQATCTDSNKNNDTNRDGNWHEGSANCTAITCPVSFTIISNSQQSNCTSISFNDTCDITCLDGYYNDGDKQATCTDSNENNDTNRDGNWDEGSANCTAITCPVSFTIISNSQQSNCTSNNFNDTCDITCLDGYYNDGDKQATCTNSIENNDTNRDGNWDEGSANCTAITCPVLFTIISNSQQSNCTSNNFNDKCDITCLDGYYNDGDKQATCTDSNQNNDTNRDGNWDKGSANCTASCDVISPPTGMAIFIYIVRIIC